MTNTGKSLAKPRDGRGRFTRSIVTVDQDRRAAELRAASLTYAEIGERLGVDESTAFRAVQRALRIGPTEEVVQVRALELRKLEFRERALLGIMEGEHPKVDHGRIVFDQHGKPVRDYSPVIAASNALDRVAKRRADLLGLDAPRKHRVDVITEDVVEAEIRRLEAKLGLGPNDPMAEY
jgi:hypothetical protein